MAAKAKTNVMKLSAIFCCARQTVNTMLSNHSDRSAHYLDYIINIDDIKSSWELVKYSIYQYTQFKVMFLAVRMLLNFILF